MVLFSNCNENDTVNNSKPDTDTGIFYFSSVVKIGENSSITFKPVWQVYNKSEYRINIVCKQIITGIIYEFGVELPKSKKTGSTNDASFIITTGKTITVYNRLNCNYQISRLTENEIEVIFTFSGKSPSDEIVSMSEGRFSVKIPK